MDAMNYFIYDGGELIAGFVSLCTAVSFAEEWRHPGAERPIPVDLVDSKTGEVINTWVNGIWRRRNF